MCELHDNDSYQEYTVIDPDGRPRGTYDALSADAALDQFYAETGSDLEDTEAVLTSELG